MTTDQQKAISELNAKLAALATKEQLLRGELTGDVAYEAHALNDAKAKKRVQEIAIELTAIGIEAESVKAAITQAEKLAKQARETANTKLQEERARKALQAAKSLRDCARAADKALSSFVIHVSELRALLAELREHGGPLVGNVDLAFQRAMAAGLMGSKLQTIHLPPSQRSSFSDLAAGYSVNVVGHCERILGSAREAA